MVQRASKNILLKNISFNSAVFILTAFIVLFDILNGNELFLIPLFFLISYTLFFLLLKTKHNFISLFITSISYIRFVILPTLYSDSLSSSFVSYVNYRFVNIDLTIFIMVVETFSVMAGLYFGYRINMKNNSERISKKSISGIFSLAVIFLGFALIFLEPNLIFGIGNPLIKVDGSLEALFQVSLIVFSLYLIRKFECISNRKLSFVLIIFTFIFLIFFSSNMANSNSRNCMLINSIILIIYLFKRFRDYTRYFIPIIIAVVVVAFFYSTYNRFDLVSSNSSVFEAVYKFFFNYQSLNAYFAGPTNIDYGVTMIKNYDGFGLFQIFIDAASNIPFVNKLFNSANTVEIFNFTMSNGIANDQIVPFSVQSNLYFSYAFGGILPFLFSFFAMRIYRKSLVTPDLANFYCFSYIAIVLGMASILCVNSTVMLISMRAFPVIIIGFLNQILASGGIINEKKFVSISIR